jgi:hypothetical protein
MSSPWPHDPATGWSLGVANWQRVLVRANDDTVRIFLGTNTIAIHTSHNVSDPLGSDTIIRIGRVAATPCGRYTIIRTGRLSRRRLSGEDFPADS